MIDLIIQHYGSFRKFGIDTSLKLEAPATINVIKSLFADTIGKDQQILVASSVLANDSAILQDDYIIDKSCALSILPPVCGG